jgi:phosphatidylserine decarboxylase
VSNTRVQVKGIEDSLHNLFNRKIDDFNGGKVAVVRLCPADYHRYHFPCEGTVVEHVNVKGKYHSVNPLALDSKKQIFCINKRSYTLMDTKTFGRVAFMEVGAFGVAGIHQTFSGTRFSRMQEKGYFNFGGSTIVLVFQKNTIEFEADLLKNSRKGIETLVKVGETIAHAV